MQNRNLSADESRMVIKAGKRSIAGCSGERGISIVIVAVSMVFILGMAGLAIDLAALYVARSQAQRAADAAALAGAQAFVLDNCVTGDGSNLSMACTTLARQTAQTVADQNLIAGVSPNLKLDTDITFPNQTTTDPQIHVVAGRGTYDNSDHGNALPTFFVKIFGIDTASVSASATAEAFNPSGTSGTMGTTCLKPWMFPNCDQFNTTVDPNYQYCQPGVGPFIIPIGQNEYKVARPVNYPDGAIGEPYVIRPGSPGSAAAPGQYYISYLPSSDSIPSSCPNCAKNPPSWGGNGSGALYEANIECCNDSPIYCGETLKLDTSLQSTSGAKAGPTTDGVECLINQNTGSSNCGQDYIDGISTSPCDDPPSQNAADLPPLPQIPPSIVSGVNDRYWPSDTAGITNSSSVVVAPIFDGIIASGQNTVQVAGFVQLFLRDVYVPGNPKGTVFAYVLNISACGGGGSGDSASSQPPTAAASSVIPVRLIHQ
ncbi:MAG: pilus assembly protein TadG-related protein [Acidobacteria bacterium]|nr:pilus assembly protein TadG-related protein [Acidobacteriota bacterium]